MTKRRGGAAAGKALAVAVAAPMGDGPNPSSKEPPSNSFRNEEEEAAIELERRYVRHVYDAIAPHFGATRYKAWPLVERFVRSVAPAAGGPPAGLLLLDVGAGNGKNLGLQQPPTTPSSSPARRRSSLRRHRRGRLEFAVESCAAFASMCAARPGAPAAVVADACTLPFRSAPFDAVVCIAVLHHLASHARRVA